MTRKGFDKRTGKPVVIIGEVAGHKLFSGKSNRRLTDKQTRELAAKIVVLCRLQKISPLGLGLSLVGLGDAILVAAVKMEGK